MEGPYAQGNKTAAFLVRMSLERWASRHLRADNTSVIVAYFDPPGTSSVSLTREGSTVSNASTLPISDVVCNLSNRFEVDAELDPSFYDDIYASLPTHTTHGCHRKRKHAKKARGEMGRNGASRSWSLSKSNYPLQKKLRGSSGTGEERQSCEWKNKYTRDGIPWYRRDGTPYKVLIGRSDKFVSASSSVVTVEPCVERDKHLDGDSACLDLVQAKSISVYEPDATASGYGSHGVRQVACNITNSSHCLHKSEPPAESDAVETKHDQVPRAKFQETSAEGETSTALVSPMWPRSMVSTVSEKAFNRCRKRKPLRKAGKKENEDKLRGARVKRDHSPGGCRPLKRRRTDSVKARLSTTVIHRTRLHAKTMRRSS